MKFCIRWGNFNKKNYPLQSSYFGWNEWNRANDLPVARASLRLFVLHGRIVSNCEQGDQGANAATSKARRPPTPTLKSHTRSLRAIAKLFEFLTAKLKTLRVSLQHKVVAVVFEPLTTKKPLVWVVFFGWNEWTRTTDPHLIRVVL